MNGLVAGGCHFQAFLVGSKPSRSIFLRFLELKNKRKKQGKNVNFGEIFENFWKYRKKLENVGKNQEKTGNRNFGGDILSISIENQNFVEISAEISEIFFLGYT